MKNPFKNRHQKEKEDLQKHRHEQGFYGLNNQIKEENTNQNNKKMNKSKVRDLTMFTTDEFTAIERMQDTMVGLTASYANLDSTKNTEEIQKNLVETMKHLSEAIKDTILKVDDGQLDLPLEDTTKKDETKVIPHPASKGKHVNQPQQKKEDESSKKDKPVQEDTKKAENNASSVNTEKKAQDGIESTNGQNEEKQNGVQNESKKDYSKAIEEAKKNVQQEIAELTKGDCTEITVEDRDALIVAYQTPLPDDHTLKTNTESAGKAVDKILDEAEVTIKVETAEEPTNEVTDTEIVEEEVKTEETAEKKEITKEDIQAEIDNLDSEESDDDIIDDDTEEAEVTLDLDKIKEEVKIVESDKAKAIISETVRTYFTSDMDKEDYKMKMLKLFKEVKAETEVPADAKDPQLARNAIWGSNKEILKDIAGTIEEVSKAA